MVLSKLWTLLEKSSILLHLSMSTSAKKFYNLYFLCTSTIWSTEYDLEYEIVLEKVL